jgi:nitrogen fixation-related uncharacterized protein
VNPLGELPISHAEELPQAAPGVPDLTKVMMQWGVRAKQYNDLREMAGDLLDERQRMRQKVVDARTHCANQSKKLRDCEKRVEEVEETLSATNRTSLPKDQILRRLDRSAFKIAASGALLEHAAQDIIPPSMVIRFSDGREEIFQDGDQQRQRMLLGLQDANSILAATAEEVLQLGAPLTEKRRPPFTFPTEVLNQAKAMPGGLTLENIRASYTQQAASERVTLDVSHNEDDVVGEIVRLQTPAPLPTRVKEESGTPSAPPVEQKTKSKAKRAIKSEGDAATRSSEKAQELHKKRMRPNTTIILQGSTKQINNTKKQATAHLWNDYGHVVPLQADTDMRKHQGESAFRCSSLHGTGWDVYGSKPAGKEVCWCPECNKKMTETVPFVLPAGRYVYQLRLKWGLDEEGNVVNPDGIAIDRGFNNVTFYAEDAPGASNDGWTEGSRWTKKPVQQDAKKSTDPSKPTKATESMPSFDAGPRRAKNSNIFKGNSNSWAELATFHTKRFDNKIPKFVKSFGGSAPVNIALQTLIQAVATKLKENDSDVFDITKDWFVAQDLRDWSSEKRIDAFLRDVGMVIKKRAKKGSSKRGSIKLEEDQDIDASKKRKSDLPPESDDDDDGDGQRGDEGRGRKRQKRDLKKVPEIEQTTGEQEDEEIFDEGEDEGEDEELEVETQ